MADQGWRAIFLVLVSSIMEAAVLGVKTVVRTVEVVRASIRLLLLVVSAAAATVDSLQVKILLKDYRTGLGLMRPMESPILVVAVAVADGAVANKVMVDPAL